MSAMCYSMAAGMTVRGVAATMSSATMSSAMSAAAMSFSHRVGRDCDCSRHCDNESELS